MPERMRNLEPAPSRSSSATSPDWEPRHRPWSEYPLGTQARDNTNARWTKVQGGWQAHGGDTFPTPSADAFEVLFPSATSPEPETVVYPLRDALRQAIESAAPIPEPTPEGTRDA